MVGVGQLGGAWAIVRRGGLGASPGVKDLEVVVTVTQLMGELYHLEAPRAGTKAFRSEHDERPDDHSAAGPAQRPL